MQEAKPQSVESPWVHRSWDDAPKCKHHYTSCRECENLAAAYRAVRVGVHRQAPVLRSPFSAFSYWDGPTLRLAIDCMGHVFPGSETIIALNDVEVFEMAAQLNAHHPGTVGLMREFWTDALDLTRRALYEVRGQLLSMKTAYDDESRREIPY